eukprot:1530054-Pyramimonas_sp.AAC.1
MPPPLLPKRQRRPAEALSPIGQGPASRQRDAVSLVRGRLHWVTMPGPAPAQLTAGCRGAQVRDAESPRTTSE